MKHLVTSAEGMSESLSDAVREAAQTQIVKRGLVMEGAWSFLDGAAWVAGRLPSRDEIAEALFGEYGCDCGDALESHSPLDREDSYRGADKILALIREHVTR